MARLLLVEDDVNLGETLVELLEMEGFDVNWVGDGRQALERYDPDIIDLVILDIMLPHIDGFTVAERIREQSLQVPILMLTARTTAVDRVRGLQTGADDYLAKPFHLKELLLRVQGMLKRKLWYRQELDEKSAYRFGDNEINFSTFSAMANGRSLRLTPLETMLLKYLIDHEGRVVSRQELLEHVWQTNVETETRTVDNFIARLRKYFEPDPSRPVYFKNVRGAGYLCSSEGESSKG